MCGVEVTTHVVQQMLSLLSHLPSLFPSLLLKITSQKRANSGVIFDSMQDVFNHKNGALFKKGPQSLKRGTT